MGSNERNRPIPDFLIGGAQKCGTTSLYYWLKSHPECYMADIKEPFYFARNEPWVRAGAEELMALSKSKYRSLFRGATAAQITGEATPFYIFAKSAPAEILKENPKAKLIILLRDPVERAYSQYRMNVLSGIEKRTFFEALLHCLRNSESERNGPLDLYLKLSMYGQQLFNVCRYFPRSQLHIVSTLSLLKAPLTVMTEVSKFLEIDDGYWHSYIFERHFEGREPRNKLTRFLVTSRLFRSAARRLVPKRLRTLVGEHVVTKPTIRHEPDPKALKLAWSQLEQDLAELEHLLGRRMPDLWQTHPEVSLSQVSARRGFLGM